MDSLSTGSSNLILQSATDPSNQQILTINSPSYELTGQRLSDGEVMTISATIVRDSQGPRIECNTSGLMVNNEPTQSALLNRGDSVQVGYSTYHVVDTGCLQTGGGSDASETRVEEQLKAVETNLMAASNNFDNESPAQEDPTNAGFQTNPAVDELSDAADFVAEPEAVATQSEELADVFAQSYSTGDSVEHVENETEFDQSRSEQTDVELKQSDVQPTELEQLDSNQSEPAPDDKGDSPEKSLERLLAALNSVEKPAADDSVSLLDPSDAGQGVEEQETIGLSQDSFETQQTAADPSTTESEADSVIAREHDDVPVKSTGNRLIGTSDPITESTDLAETIAEESDQFDVGTDATGESVNVDSDTSQHFQAVRGGGFREAGSHEQPELEEDYQTTEHLNPVTHEDSATQFAPLAEAAQEPGVHAEIPFNAGDQERFPTQPNFDQSQNVESGLEESDVSQVTTEFENMRGNDETAFEETAFEDSARQIMPLAEVAQEPGVHAEIPFNADQEQLPPQTNFDQSQNVESGLQESDVSEVTAEFENMHHHDETPADSDVGTEATQVEDAVNAWREALADEQDTYTFSQSQNELSEAFGAEPISDHQDPVDTIAPVESGFEAEESQTQLQINEGFEFTEADKIAEETVVNSDVASQPDNEAEFEEECAEEDTSVAAVLARMNMTPSLEDNATQDIESVQAQIAEAECQSQDSEETEEFADEQAAQTGAGEDSEDVQNYMSSLLQRLNDGAPENEVKPAGKQNEKSGKSKQVVDDAKQQEDFKEPVKPLRPDEFLPKRVAPEVNSNMAAMRALANAANKNALSISMHKKTKLTRTWLLTTALSSFLGSIFFFLLSHNITDIFSILSMICVVVGLGTGFFFLHSQLQSRAGGK